MSSDFDSPRTLLGYDSHSDSAGTLLGYDSHSDSAGTLLGYNASGPVHEWLRIPVRQSKYENPGTVRVAVIYRVIQSGTEHGTVRHGKLV